MNDADAALVGTAVLVQFSSEEGALVGHVQTCCEPEALPSLLLNVAAVVCDALNELDSVEPLRLEEVPLLNRAQRRRLGRHRWH